MQVKSFAEYSEGLSTFIELPFVIKIFVLSIFERPFYTDFTVLLFIYLILSLLLLLLLLFPVLFGLDCFQCYSFNKTDPHCGDPFHPAYGNYVKDCTAGKEGRIGNFPARHCIKLIGTTGMYY